MTCRSCQDNGRDIPVNATSSASWCFPLGSGSDGRYRLPRAERDISWHCDTCVELPEASREKRKNKADLWRFQSTWHFGDARQTHRRYTAFTSDESVTTLHDLQRGVQHSQESSAQVVVMPKKTSYWINWIILLQFKSLILFTYARIVLVFFEPCNSSRQRRLSKGMWSLVMWSADLRAFNT